MKKDKRKEKRKVIKRLQVNINFKDGTQKITKSVYMEPGLKSVLSSCADDTHRKLHNLLLHLLCLHVGYDGNRSLFESVSRDYMKSSFRSWNQYFLDIFSKIDRSSVEVFRSLKE